MKKSNKVVHTRKGGEEEQRGRGNTGEMDYGEGRGLGIDRMMDFGIGGRWNGIERCGTLLCTKPLKNDHGPLIWVRVS